MKTEKEKVWEEDVLEGLLLEGKNYEPYFFSKMLIKYLYATTE